MLHTDSIARALTNILTSRRYRVQGDSMLPNLASNQYVLLASLCFPWGQLKRGEIVVFRNPGQTNEVYVKRIVGMPGEDIQLEGGKVYLNGTVLEESYSTIPALDGERGRGEWWTGPDEYLLLGDNRRESQDSRSFGPVSRRLVLGRVWFRYWPPGTWGPISGKATGGESQGG